MLPFTYTPDRSLAVHGEFQSLLEESGHFKKITELAWAYHDVGDLIPHPLEALWSGHFFPWVESWEDLQISCTLCLFGLYKQAMASLRSALELGLLSVYWNLNDDGHTTVKSWLRSRQDTPRSKEIWRRLASHPNFQAFQEQHDLKARILDLGFLHDYVHTKGRKYSNAFGIMKSNYQTLERSAFDTWFSSFAEVIRVLAICHLIKYPLGVIHFPWSKKFGIDTPMFGGLDGHQVDRLHELVGDNIFQTLTTIAANDPHVAGIVEWAQSLPDMSAQDVKDQIVNMDKQEIEMSGLPQWLKNQRVILNHVEDKEHYERRIALLTAWAKENGFDKPRSLLPGTR